MANLPRLDEIQQSPVVAKGDGSGYYSKEELLAHLDGTSTEKFKEKYAIGTLFVTLLEVQQQVLNQGAWVHRLSQNEELNSKTLRLLSQRQNVTLDTLCDASQGKRFKMQRIDGNPVELTKSEDAADSHGCFGFLWHA